MSQPQESRVSAADVRNVKFQLIRRGGYDPGQVDPFLEVVAQTLEGGPYADWRINGEYIHGVRFTTVRRGGYMPAQVDAFLDRVIDTFDAFAREGRHPSEGAQAPMPAVADQEPAASAPAPVANDWPSLPEQPEPAQPAPVADQAPLPPPPEPAPAFPEPAAAPAMAEPPAPLVAAPPPPAAAEEPEQPVAEAPSAATAIDSSPEADFERLRILHDSGVLSDKEFAVLGARVKRRINAQQSAVVG